jgi:glutathione S-transferase/pterin-4a-carbinolamine dehydratase
MKIYCTAACPYCLRVKLALKCRNIIDSSISFEEIDIKNPPKELLKINPTGAVPSLEIRDGLGFGGSTAIIEYLDILPGLGDQLFPKNREENGQLKFLLEILTDRFIHVLEKIFFPKKSFLNQNKELEKISQAFLFLKNVLENSQNAPFFGGKNLNAVDVHLAPFIIYYLAANYFDKRFFLPKSDLKLMQYFEDLKNHSMIKSVFPDIKKCAHIFKSNEHSFSEEVQFIQSCSREILKDFDFKIERMNKQLSCYLNKEYFDFWKKSKNNSHDCIIATFYFKDQEAARSALEKLDFLQEACNHHTHFILQNFQELRVELSTHEPRPGVSEMDLAFASLLSRILLS